MESAKGGEVAVVAIQTHGLRVRAATLGHEVEHRQPRAGSEPVWVELSPENHLNTRSGIPPPARGCHRARHFGPYLKIRLVKVSWM